MSFILERGRRKGINSGKKRKSKHERGKHFERRCRCRFIRFVEHRGEPLGTRRVCEFSADRGEETENEKASIMKKEKIVKGKKRRDAVRSGPPG